MSPRSACDRLRDILDAVDKATTFGQRDRDELATAAALYELIVIGEAVNALPTDVLADTSTAFTRASETAALAGDTGRPGGRGPSPVWVPPPRHEPHDPLRASRPGGPGSRP